jgi:hypothetical protein
MSLIPIVLIPNFFSFVNEDAEFATLSIAGLERLRTRVQGNVHGMVTNEPRKAESTMVRTEARRPTIWFVSM